jgi:DNA-binding MurR/RpiR family transcriptional regulator
MHATSEYSISDLAELFSISRPTVYRTFSQLRSEIGDGDFYRAFRVAEGLHESFYAGTLPAEGVALDLLT